MTATKNKGKSGASTEIERKRPSGLGLGGMNLSKLMDKPKGEKPQSGLPLDIPLDLIDEDINQPRKADNPGFSEESIKELAKTIKDRGVKSPISVRDNPDMPGRYLINHGARRYRASKHPLAEKTTIPGFVDNDYLEVDQVIENLQRNDLTPREIADWIGREQAKGKKNKEIAADLGKSPSYITQHAALLDLPEPIADAFNTGRVQDVTLISELIKAHKSNAEQVANWLVEEDQEITRGSVRELRDFLEEKQSDSTGGGNEVDNGRVNSGAAEEQSDPQQKNTDGAKDRPQPDPEKLKKAIVQVQYDERPGRLLLNRRPPADGFAWIKYDDDGQEVEVNLANVRLVALMEA